MRKRTHIKEETGTEKQLSQTMYVLYVLFALYVLFVLYVLFALYVLYGGLQAGNGVRVEAGEVGMHQRFDGKNTVRRIVIKATL